LKRPERTEWNIQYRYYEGNKDALAEHFGVTITTIYNWLHYFKENEDVILRDLEVVSDIDPKEILSHKEYVKLQTESPNQPKKRRVIIQVPDSALILMLADYHCGSVYTDSMLAEEIKDVCATHENVYAFFNGDLLDYEGSGPEDIRYDQAFSHPSTTRAMAEAWVKEFNGSMILMVTGCHDNWVYRHTGETFMERLTKYIPTNAVFNDSVLIELKVGDISYFGHVAHKAGKGHSSYNPSHGGFRELREDFDGDFVVSAHRHIPGIAMQMVRGKPCLVVNCDSFKSLDHFSNKNFIDSPTYIGAVYFDGKEKRMIPFFDWRDGIRYIQTYESQQKNLEQLP